MVVFALFPFLGHAQHEFSVYGGGGLSGLSYKSDAGKQKNGFGGQFGLGYRFYFTSNVGIGTGIEYAPYNAKFKADNVNSGHRATDFEDVAFDFRSSVTGYEEKQNAAFLQIPLMLQYLTDSDQGFYVAGGFKAGIPLSGKYSSTASMLQNSGFYSEEIYEYTTQQFMGFGTFNGITSKGDLTFKTAFFLSLEAGMKFGLSGNFSLYAGAYLDYALNNAVKKPSLLLVAYNTTNPTDFTLNSVANSQYAQNGVAQSFTDKIAPVAAGVKIVVAMGSRNNKYSRRR